MWIRVHQIVVLAYVLLPVGALFLAVGRGRVSRQERNKALFSCAMLAAASAVMGIAVSIIFGVSLGGVVPVSQVLLTCYFIASLICVLKLLDFGLDRFFRWIFQVGRGTRLVAERRILAMILRGALLFLIGLPYIMAAAFTYHPKAIVKPDPGWAELGAVPIQCTATDGMHLAGFWVQAGDPPHDRAKGTWGRETVIICHGQTAGKASYLKLVQELSADGYNVLTFDFRGYGQSGGQMVTFGDRERCDVLGMVRWVKTNFPDRCQKIDGIGMGSGGAALLAAAADPGPEGHALQSLVICGCYDTFDDLAGDYFAPPLNWLVVHLGVTMASAQTGVNLSDFSPADAAVAVAPRPIMFIHGKKDRIIRFELGQNLFQAACAAKTALWLDGVEDEAINGPSVPAAVRRFLDRAVPMI